MIEPYSTFAGPSITEAEAQSLCDEAVAEFKLSPIKVKIVEPSKSNFAIIDGALVEFNGWYERDKRQISLVVTRGDRESVLLHEIAHAMSSNGTHGTEFQENLMTLKVWRKKEKNKEKMGIKEKEVTLA